MQLSEESGGIKRKIVQKTIMFHFPQNRRIKLCYNYQKNNIWQEMLLEKELNQSTQNSGIAQIIFQGVGPKDRPLKLFGRDDFPDNK